jgi:hypothetical protein
MEIVTLLEAAHLELVSSDLAQSLASDRDLLETEFDRECKLQYRELREAQP